MMYLIWLFPPDTGPRHTPMYVTPVTKRTGADGDITWSPYTAADEVAKIPTPTNTVRENKYFVRIIQYCRFQNSVRVYGDLSDDYKG